MFWWTATRRANKPDVWGYLAFTSVQQLSGNAGVVPIQPS